MAGKPQASAGRVRAAARTGAGALCPERVAAGKTRAFRGTRLPECRVARRKKPRKGDLTAVEKRRLKLGPETLFRIKSTVPGSVNGLSFRLESRTIEQAVHYR
jgi:hypothetical protein